MRPRADIAGLYALTPDLDDTVLLTDRVSAALRGGATAIQYRNKSATPVKRIEQAFALRTACDAHGALLFVNDDVELAVAVGADGVHLGRDDMSIAAARARLGSRALIGVSCYNEWEHARSAVETGADYIAFGSFFSSSVKRDAVRAETALIIAAKATWTVPVVAIGGITAANAAPLVEAGADALAVITAVFGASDIEAAARELVSLFVPLTAHRRPVK